MKVAVIGTGYVGLVSGVCLAARGHEVVCVDLDPSIVERINRGEPPIHERGLPALLGEILAARRFHATLDLPAALNDAEIALVAVGTPSTNGAIDLAHTRAAARAIGAVIATTDRHISVVVKSTVVAGTTDTIVREEIERASGKRLGQFGLGMNPEFLREGEAIVDFMEPDRIVLGFEDDITLGRLHRLYASWNVDKLAVNTRTAELIKYANNALLATQISAVNELANLASAIGGIDIMEVMSGVHLDKRWNPLIGGERANPGILTYLVPGCGFGGSCFPKDVQALRSQGEFSGLPMPMLNAVLATNEAQPNQIRDILLRECGSLDGRRVLLLGLAFKPETDDVRESASLRIAADLLAAGAILSAHDPVAIEPFSRAMGNASAGIAFVADWRSVLPQSEIIVIATRWAEYAALPGLPIMGKTVFDARRMLRPEDMVGARYLSIGYGGAEAPPAGAPSIAEGAARAMPEYTVEALS